MTGAGIIEGRGKSKRWTTAERITLRGVFQAGGAKAVHALLPHRSLASIYSQAEEIGCKSKDAKNPRRAFPVDERIDAQIIALSQRGAKRGDWAKLARKLNRPQAYMTSRLRALGYLNARVSERQWMDAEDALLRETTHLAPTTASAYFKARGFKRSTWAITLRRRRLRLDCTKFGEYTGSELSGLLGQDKGAVYRWISSGLLECKRKGTAPTAERDHFVITERQLRAFICTHPLRLDLRRVPPANIPWLIDVISGSLKN